MINDVISGFGWFDCNLLVSHHVCVEVIKCDYFWNLLKLENVDCCGIKVLNYYLSWRVSSNNFSMRRRTCVGEKLCLIRNSETEREKNLRNYHLTAQQARNYFFEAKRKSITRVSHTKLLDFVKASWSLNSERRAASRIS